MAHATHRRQDQPTQQASGTGNPGPAIHWPTLTLVAGVAGFAACGLIALAWGLTRPPAPVRTVVLYPLEATADSWDEAPALPEPVALVRGEDKPATVAEDADGSRRAAPDLAGEPVAAYKKATADLPEPPAAPPAQLVAEPAAEEGCAVPGTAVRFARTLKEATRQAREQDKLLIVLHISGHFEDPGFT